MNQHIAIYRALLADINTRIRAAQHRAARSANAEMIHLYWDIGRLIAAKQEHEGWGAGVIPRLAVDLKNELPKEKGFSERNIKLMVQFFKTDPDPFEMGQPSVAQLPTHTPMEPQATAQLYTLQQAVLAMSWAHNVILIQKLKDLPTRLWYGTCQTLAQGWSRDTLILQIKNRAHERQGAAITNFTTTLPSIHASLAHSLLHNPYIFDFLTAHRTLPRARTRDRSRRPHPEIPARTRSWLCLRRPPIPTRRQRS
jgi:predicted nuclease of restriction endonuclease-like (RecB) superfamily